MDFGFTLKPEHSLERTVAVPVLDQSAVGAGFRAWIESTAASVNKESGSAIVISVESMKLAGSSAPAE